MTFFFIISWHYQHLLTRNSFQISFSPRFHDAIMMDWKKNQNFPKNFFWNFFVKSGVKFNSASEKYWTDRNREKMQLYNLTLQKATNINHAVHGNYSGQKQQEIAVSRGTVVEILKECFIKRWIRGGTHGGCQNTPKWLYRC